MPHTGSGDLVADRDETKFLIDERAARGLAGVLGRHLPGLSPPTGARITTVYFDTPGGAILGAARTEGRSIKVRVKEYELRGDSNEVWLELKLREGERTGKLRTGISRGRVLDAVGGAGPGKGSVFDALARLRAALDGPLVPVCTVSYRRLAWETDDERIRVTIDTAIRFAGPPSRAWDEAPLAQLAPPPVGEFAGGLLELKLRVPSPTWLAEQIEGMGLSRSPFSKFVAGSDAVRAG